MTRSYLIGGPYDGEWFEVKTDRPLSPSIVMFITSEKLNFKPVSVLFDQSEITIHQDSFEYKYKKMANGHNLLFEDDLEEEQEAIIPPW